MAKKILYLLAPEDGERPISAWRAQWCDAEGNPQAFEGTVAEAAPELQGHRVTLILPSELAYLASVELPNTASARLPQLAAYAIEEQLAEDIDDLHIALGPKVASRYWVAATQRQRLEQLLEQLRQQGVYPAQVSVAPLAVAQPADRQWVIVADAEGAIARDDAHQAISGERDVFPFLLDRMLQQASAEDVVAAENADGDSTPPRLQLYTSGDTDWLESVLAALPTAAFSQITREAIDMRVEAFAMPGDRDSLNLLQGAFKPGRQFNQQLKTWRVPAALAALLLVALGGQSFAEYVELGRRDQQLQQQLENTLHQVMPNARYQDIRRQFGAALRSQSGSGDQGFLQLLAVFAQSTEQIDGIAPNAISFRNQRLDLDITAPQFNSFDRLKLALESQGELQATIQSVTKQGEQVRGRVRVEAGGAP